LVSSSESTPKSPHGELKKKQDTLCSFLLIVHYIFHTQTHTHDEPAPRQATTHDQRLTDNDYRDLIVHSPLIFTFRT
jgi:hypothetical protein